MCGVDCERRFKGSGSRVIKDHLQWFAFISYKLLQGWMFTLNTAKVSNNDLRLEKEWGYLLTGLF